MGRCTYRKISMIIIIERNRSRSQKGTIIIYWREEKTATIKTLETFRKTTSTILKMILWRNQRKQHNCTLTLFFGHFVKTTISQVCFDAIDFKMIVHSYHRNNFDYEFSYQYDGCVSQAWMNTHIYSCNKMNIIEDIHIFCYCNIRILT